MNKKDLLKLDRSELQDLHKKYFEKGSRDKNDEIIDRLVAEYNRRAAENNTKMKSDTIEVIANKRIRQSFGKLRIEAEKGQRFMVPMNVYDYWMKGVQAHGKASPVRLPPKDI